MTYGQELLVFNDGEINVSQIFPPVAKIRTLARHKLLTGFITRR
jgi:hypothetical protein